MGKQENATIYYCDKCREPVIGTPAIIKTAQYTSVAHGVPLNANLQEEDVPFTQEPINVFSYISFETEIAGQNESDGSFQIGLKPKLETKYLCKNCAEKVYDEYAKAVNALADVFSDIKVQTVR